MPAPEVTADSAPNKLQCRLLIVAAAVMWSTGGFFAKAPFFEAWPEEVDGWPVRGPLLAFWRTLFASVVLFPLVRRPRWTLKLVPGVIAFAMMSVTFLTAVTKTTAANAIWLQHTAPAWVLLFGVLLLGETIHRRDWLLVGFALAGVGVILAFELQGESAGGMAYGLLAGLTYASVVLSLRWLRTEDAAWLVALNHFATAIILLPYILYQGIWPTVGQLFFLCAFGMLQMGFPYWLFARGIRGVAGHEASGLVLLEPLLVPLWVFLAWRHTASYEPPAAWTFVGGGLILTGLICRYVGLRSTDTATAE
jgi:drug/metabolite transporter (DMT)-like permease